MKRSLFAVGVLLIVCSIVVLAQTPVPDKDPRLGTWKINFAKSTPVAGPQPQLSLKRWESRPDGSTVFTQAIIDAQGNPHFIHNAYKLDGKDYPSYRDADLLPVLAGTQKPGTTSVKLVDAYTVFVSTKDGKGVAAVPYAATVSKDGKTLTYTSKGRNAQGQEINNVTIHDRQ